MSKIRERHGIPDARKIPYGVPESQWVTVTDGDTDEVWLGIGTATHVAGITPDQARYIARQLEDSAYRIESRTQDAVKK